MTVKLDDDPTRAVRLRETEEYFAPLPSLELDPSFRMTASGLHITGTPSFETWEHVGRLLYRAQEAVQWALGDWWIHGKDNYGARAELVREMLEDQGDEDQDDKQADRLLRRFRNVGWVARAIESSRRRDALKFSHHAAVAKLEPAQQDELLEQAVQGGWTVRELRQRVQAPDELAGESGAAAADATDESEQHVQGDDPDAGSADAEAGWETEDGVDAGAESETHAEPLRPLSRRAKYHLRQMATVLMEEMQEGCDRRLEIRMLLSVSRALQACDTACACRATGACEHQRVFEGAARHALTAYTVNVDG